MTAITIVLLEAVKWFLYGSSFVGVLYLLGQAQASLPAFS